VYFQGKPFDYNEDGGVNNLDLVMASNAWKAGLGGVDTAFMQALSDYMGVEGPHPSSPANYFMPIPEEQDVTTTYTPAPAFGIAQTTTPQLDLGISTGAVGSRKELSRMLESYKARTSLIQVAQRQKAVFTIDRFDGGLNLNKAPRDLSYWEACQMDELTPSKAGRLVRLGDFTTYTDYAVGIAAAHVENYGLFYFKWSNSLNADYTQDAGTPTNYFAIDDGDTDVALWNFDDADDPHIVDAMITGMNTSFKAVYHNADNRLYVSDAAFLSDKTLVCGIHDRPNLFPFTHTDGTLKYNVTAGAIEGDDDMFSTPMINNSLIKAAPKAGITTAGDICVTTNSAGYALNGTYHQGIYVNVLFADQDVTETGTGWGGLNAGEAKYYKFFASFLYDNGSETKLTDVTGTNNTHNDIGDTAVVATATTNASTGVYQKLVIRQVLIDCSEFDNQELNRVHGARFYYTETDSSGNPLGADKFLFAELDFRYGLQLASEHGVWHQFENEDGDGTTPTLTELLSLQIQGAAETSGDTAPDGTLSIPAPPVAFTFYSLNLFYQEEIKDDLLWGASTMGNGVAFIGNVKYDNRRYPDTMLYSGAGETSSGSVYPMWGVFPVDSNRIDIPGTAGEITALHWTANRVLQFRENALYIINVEDVLSPIVEGVYQGMGVAGQYAVTATPFGCAWVNENGAYAYNAEEKKVRSLTMGRLDAEDFGANVNSKIGYDDRAKMLIIANYGLAATDNYHYAYSFVTDAWCTWNYNANSDTPKTNFAIDQDGYLTGGTASTTNLRVRKWMAQAQTAQTVDYITKDIDFGKPNLDKRFYTLYISFTGGANQDSMFVYYRINGMEGTDLANGWTQFGTVFDFTNPYLTNQGGAWGTSADGSTALGGDAFVPGSVDDLDSLDTDDVQKLAKINLRHLGTSTSTSDDIFKFARSIQFRIKGTAATTFEINDISLVYKEKRLK